jgi:multidrug efflux pump subunit AcrA (membrane-fusion protein)
VPSAGIVRQFSVQVGDNVLAGQPLATIASRS